MSEDTNPTAQQVTDVMWRNDNASKGLGMRIEEVGLGYARLSMPIAENMTNGQKIAHGGFIFTLADSTFAFACNAYNQFAVAQHCAVTFIAAGFAGDTLTATAVERSKSSRSGIYDVTVVNQNNEVIAEFRGHSRTVKGQHIPHDGEQ